MVETWDDKEKNNRLLPLNPKRCDKDRMIYVKKKCNKLYLFPSFKKTIILTNHIKLYLCDYMYTAIDNLKDGFKPARYYDDYYPIIIVNIEITKTLE